MRFFLMALCTASLLAAAGGCKGKPSATEAKDVWQITVDESGFVPNKIAAKKGKPLTLVFNRTAEHTCANEVVIASERIRKELPLNATVNVTFIPEKVGDIHFACPMNMITGEITVVP